MQTVKSSYGKGVHLVAPSSRKQYLLTCPPCKTYNVFDLCHHALAASGIVMEYLMEVVKKFEKKKKLIIFVYRAYKPTLTVSQLGMKKNEISKPNSKRLEKNDGRFMKTSCSAGGIETSENYNTRTPLSNCSESRSEIITFVTKFTNEK